MVGAYWWGPTHAPRAEHSLSSCVIISDMDLPCRSILGIPRGPAAASVAFLALIVLALWGVDRPTDAGRTPPPPSSLAEATRRGWRRAPAAFWSRTENHPSGPVEGLGPLRDVYPQMRAIAHRGGSARNPEKSLPASPPPFYLPRARDASDETPVWVCASRQQPSTSPYLRPLA